MNKIRVQSISSISLLRSYCTKRFTNHHQWVTLDGNKGKLGLSYVANQRMGEIVYVELPTNGEKYKTNQPIGTIQSCKAVCEILAPINVEIDQVNQELKSAPELLNVDTPLFSFISSDVEGYGNLMDKDEYEQFVSNENQMTKEKTNY